MSRITESYIEIMNLVYAYPERIDAGDFAGVGELFADAVFETEGGAPLVGSRAVQENFERWTRRYPDDGTPKTRHCIHNPIVEIDEAGDSAVVRYYVTVFQRTPDFPLQPVWANRYEDRFVRKDGRWRYAHRRGFGHMPGNVSAHLLLTPPQGR
jgi:ketosteroid isomerase-like protein